MQPCDNAILMETPNTLTGWLAYCEQLHPKGINGIELGLERIRAVAERMDLRFDCPVITVAGTNDLRHAGEHSGSGGLQNWRVYFSPPGAF
jgi:D-serine deaminase-like pyridoxal phosphate-dependent protein